VLLFGVTVSISPKCLNLLNFLGASEHVLGRGGVRRPRLHLVCRRGGGGCGHSTPVNKLTPDANCPHTGSKVRFVRVDATLQGVVDTLTLCDAFQLGEPFAHCLTFSGRCLVRTIVGTPFADQIITIGHDSIVLTVQHLIHR